MKDTGGGGREVGDTAMTGVVTGTDTGATGVVKGIDAGMVDETTMVVTGQTGHG